MSYYRLQARAPEPKTKKAAPRFARPCVRNPLWQGLSAALAIMSLYQIHYSKFRQNPADGRVAPLRLSRRGGNALRRQRLCDLERGKPRKEITEDAMDYFRLFLIDDQSPIFALVVAEEVLVVEAVLAV